MKVCKTCNKQAFAGLGRAEHQTMRDGLSDVPADELKCPPRIVAVLLI